MFDLLRISPGFLVGAIVACALPKLAPLPIAIVVLLIALAMLWVARPAVQVAASVAMGAAWFVLEAQTTLQSRWPETLDGQDVPIQIEVVGLPEFFANRTRFLARVIEAERLTVGTRLRLSWYAPAPHLEPGDRIAATVRLKRPRGLINPGGLDLERQALVDRIAAFGYVRSGKIIGSNGGRIDRLRLRIAERIEGAVSDPTIAALLRALAVGDTRGLREAHWDQLRATGTGHLIAISGLHIGLVAAFGGLVAFGIYQSFPRLGRRWPRPQGMAIGALIAASGYALLAGLGVPVLRTLVMISVALAAVVLRRTLRGIDALLLAAFLIVAVDPLSLLGASFWLSFVGVAFLVWAVSRSDRGFSGLWRAQLAMSIGLLPVGAWWFAQTSIIGLVTNLFAVPWITFVIVPMLLLATAADLLLGWPGLYLLPAALLDPLWSLLGAASQLPLAQWHFEGFGIWTMVIAMLGAAWVCLPRGVPMRWAGLPMLLPLLWPARVSLQQGEFELTVFDVGQGLSVLIRTRDHAMLYDTGARWGEDRDVGEAVVVPSLYALGVRRLDEVMISHLDDDHSGGRESVLRAFPTAQQRIGNAADPSPRCVAGQSWRWDGVDFLVLHPPPFFPDLDNDNSCVLRVASSHGRALLTGDISTVIEQRLARESKDAVDVDLVVAAHHGSRHSSSQPFVAATSAEFVVFSRGWRNRFGHPAPEVVERWLKSGSTVLDTAVQGALTIRFSAHGRSIEAFRESRSPFWREHGSDQNGTRSRDSDSALLESARFDPRE